MTQDVLAFTLINILLAWSCYIILMTGQVSLGNSAFMAVGAYVSSFLTVREQFSLGGALVIAAAAGFVFGGMLGAALSRVRGLYLIMVSIGVAQAVQIFFENFSPTGGLEGFRGMYGTDLTWLTVITVIVAMLLFLLSRSPAQLVLDAIRQDEMIAKAMGVNPVYVKLLMLGFGGAVAAVAGTLYAHYLMFIRPDHFGVSESIMIALYVFLGGTMNMWGPALGAAVMTILPEYLRFLQEWRITIFGAIVILLMAVRPAGILGHRITVFKIRNQSASPSAEKPVH